MKKIYSQALCLLAVLVGAEKASAQVSFSDFKIDNATAINVYSEAGTTRQATFTVKMTRALNSNVPIYQPTLYLVGGRYPEQPASGVNITSQSSWTYDNGQYVSTVAGRFPMDYGYVANQTHTGVQVVLAQNSTRSNTIGITEVTPADYVQRPPVTITNFQVDGATTVDVSSITRTVVYSMTLAKDPGYTGDFRVHIQGLTPRGDIDVTLQIVGTSSSQDWPLTGTKRTSTFSFSAPLNIRNITPDDNRLTARASNYNNAVLGGATTHVGINRVIIPCETDIYLQNNVALTGTTTSGANIYAGSAVTSGTNGPVMVRGGATTTLIARGSIMLAPGFSVDPGATFSAYLNGSVCSASRYAGDSTTNATPTGRYAAANATASKLTEPTAFKAVANEIPANVQELVVYPNPVQDKLVISVPQQGDNSRQVTIYSAQGARVQQLVLPVTQQEIDVHNLPTGIYYLQVKQQEQTLKTRFTIAR